MSLIKGSDFAKEAGGVSRAAVTLARNRGEILQDFDGLYDTEHPDNAAYIVKQLYKITRREHKKLDKLNAPKPKPKPEPKKTKPNQIKKTAKSKPEAKKKLSKPKKSKPDQVKKTTKKTPKPKTVNPNINQTARDYGITRADKDLLLLDVKLKTAEMNYEILIKNVVTREEIQHVWNKIFKASSYFGDFGQRYAAEWGSALGVSEPSKISDLEKLIDIATETFMLSFSETVASDV